MPDINVTCEGCKAVETFVVNNKQYTDLMKPHDVRPPLQSILYNFTEQQREMFQTRICSRCYDKVFDKFDDQFASVFGSA